MPLDGTEINTPSLRTVWKTAKDKAEKAAKPKEESKFKTLEKAFKEDLGPDLDNWFKGWPDIAKVTKAKAEIDKTIVAYKKSVKESGLSAPIIKIMTDALIDIDTELGERLKQAELYHEAKSDPELAKALKSSKTDLTPIMLFARHDVANDVASLAKKAAGKIKIDSIIIEIVLDDPKVLAAAPDNDKDYNALAKQMYGAADRDKIVKDLAEALDKIAETVKGPGDASRAQGDFDKALGVVLDAAANRASAVFIKLAKDKVAAVKYKITKTAKITLLLGGLGVSIAGLASAPFTGGAHAVFAIAGILRTSRELYVTLHKLALEAEQLAAALAGDLNELLKAYKKASNNEVGAKELGKEFINSLWPEGITTISTCKTNSGELKSKISNLNVNAHSTSDKMDEALKKQRQANAEVKSFTDASKASLSPAETKRLAKLIMSEAKLAEHIQGLVEKTEKLLERVQTMQKTHEELHKVVETLAAKRPTWAEVAILVTKVAVSAGFLVGGNVGAPEGYEVVKLAHEGVEHTAQALESFAAAKEAAEDIKEMIKAHG
jgi:FtsZ-binding cell division protein ZapB